MKLLTIDEQNDRASKMAYNKHLTGVACPRCDDKVTQLQFSDTRGVTLGSVPERDVECFGCGYKSSISVLKG